MTCRIGNGAGFLGDNLDAPRRLVESAQLDYLTLEYLAELTMSILAYQRGKNPAAGYANDFIDVLVSLNAALRAQSQLRIVTNAGGVNPPSCARAAARVLADAGLGDAAIGVVSGDDLLGRLDQLQADGCRLDNLDTGQPLSALCAPVTSANVYLGAQFIAQALAAGARIVITGRVADASLTLGPAAHEFGWAWDDWNRLAGASVAGHLIECGAQVTGGLYRHWQNLDLGHVGYPIAELDSDGSAIITKPPGTGGKVSRATVIEQLVYEIGDPAHYLTPDVDVDFTTIEVEEVGENRVAVRAATGRPAPETLKATLTYAAGYKASGQLLVYGNDCVEKARACADIILTRVERAGYRLEQTHVELLGLDNAAGAKNYSPPFQGGAGGGRLGGSPEARSSADTNSGSPRELVLRLSAQDPRREALERFTKEFAPLVTAGPPGIAGYTGARSPVRPVLAYWPTLVLKDRVRPRIEVRRASDWLVGAEEDFGE